MIKKANLRVRALLVIIILATTFLSLGANAQNQELIGKAHKAVGAGDLATAIIHLKNAVRADPQDTDARWLLGRTYLEKGDGSAAEVELRRLRRFGVPRERWWLDLADAYLMQGKTRDVMGVLADPEPFAEGDEARFYLLSGAARLGLGEVESGANDLRKAVELAPDNVRAQITLARIDIAEGRYDEAENKVALALEASPDDANTWLLKGELSRLQKRNEESLSAFRRAEELDPNTKKLALIGETVTLMAMERFKEAEEIVSKLLKDDPDLLMALYLRALLDFRNGDTAKARSNLERVQAAIPNHLPSALLLGSIHYQAGNYATAEELIKRFVDKRPKLAQARKLLAAIYIRTKQAERAVEILQQGLQEGDQDPAYLALLGSALMQAGDTSKGTEYLEKAVEIAPDAAAIRAQLGLGLLAVGQIGKAEKQLSTAVELGDDLLQADLLLILTQIKQKELDRALNSVNSLISRRPDSALAHNLRGSILAAKGDIADARQEYKRSEEIQSDFLPPKLNLAALAFQERNFDSAEKHYLDVLRLEAKNQKAMIGMAKVSEARKDTAGMIQWLEKARDDDQTAALPRIYLARYQLSIGDAERASDIARELAVIYPDNSGITLLFGQTLLAAGDAIGAEDQFRHLIAQTPDSPEGWYQLAGAQLRQDKVEPARDSLNRALSKDPENLSIRVSLGRLALKAGDYQNAIEISNQIRKRDATRSEGYTIGALARVALKQLLEAEALLDRGEKTAPSQETVILHAQVLTKMEHPEQAVRVLAKWTEKNPQDMQARYNLAALYQRSKQTAAAQHEYEQIIAAEPNNAVALNNLAWIYTETKDPRALATAARAHGLRSEDPYVADTYGWARLASNQVKESIALFRRAIQQAPQVPDFRYHLATALERSGDKDGARAELTRLLSDHSKFDDRDKAVELLKSLD